MITKTQGYYIINDVPHIINDGQRVTFRDDIAYEEFNTLEELKASYLGRHPDYEFKDDKQAKARAPK